MIESTVSHLTFPSMGSHFDGHANKIMTNEKTSRAMPYQFLSVVSVFVPLVTLIYRVIATLSM